MDPDEGWHQVEQENEQLQEILRADPAYLDWLASIEAMALEPEKDYGDHG